MSITCLIVDDEPLAANLLEEYVSHVPYLRLVKKCISAFEALGFLQQQPVDLLFLDINLPHLSGMQLAQVLPADQKVIFTTAYTQYAVDSYAVNAVDYLLKPIPLSRFIKAVEKASQLIAREATPVANPVAESGTFFVKSGKAMVKLNYSQLCLVEGLKDYVVFHLENQQHIVYKRMKELEELLPPPFIRVHNSCIVNTNYIHKIEDNHVFILQHRIAIGVKYREAFLSLIRNQLM